MTAASELKSAAVVEKESRKRKTPGQKNEVVAVKVCNSAVVVKEAVEEAVKEAVLTARNGSTTAGATESVASATAEKAAFVTSGSTAATTSTAASMQATRLPVSVFSKNFRIFPAFQLNRVAPRPVSPGLFACAGCTA